MKVTAYKTVEVECEVDVDTDEILAEFRQRVDESSETYWRRLGPVLHVITRILADVKDDVIVAVPATARQTMHERLITEAARWDIKKERS